MFSRRAMMERRLCLSAASSSENECDDTDARPPILVVLVLFQKEAFHSLALTSLLQSLDESGLAGYFQLLIYDNSPRLQSIIADNIPIPFHFIQDSENGGLFRAYTTALKIAEQEKNEWLLMLDQDTSLNADFIQKLCFQLPKAAHNKRCAALVPKLLAKNQIISPARVLWGGGLLPLKKRSVGFPPFEITALNSGSLLRVSAIKAVGGFNSTFWLDYSDHWFFNRLYRMHFSVYVLDSALIT